MDSMQPAQDPAPRRSQPGRDDKGRFAAKSNTVAYWIKELDAAEKREKNWRAEAEKILELYEGEKETDNAYNILYTNTEVLLPALYNATPVPLVGRRYKDKDDLGLAVSRTLQRSLEYCVDTPDPDYTPFDDLISTAVLGALVPGRGLTWLKYDAEYEPIVIPKRTDEIEAEGAESTQGDPSSENSVPAPAQTPAAEKVTYEACCGNDVPWDKALFGAARKWANMPWVARWHSMNYTDCARAFGDDLTEDLIFSMPDKGKGCLAETGDDDDRNNIKTFGTVDVWEIWHKSTKKVIFVCREYKDSPLKEVDDPLGIAGFYPCPEPLSFFARVNSLVPVPLYMKYKNQAVELNRITVRINALIKQLKARGFYDAGIKGMDTLMSSDDGTLLPARMVSTMREGATPANSVWMMPIQEIQTTIQGLYVQREQVKNVIYEITGISDILRGSAAASESATLSKLKSQWGTMRLRRMQNRVQKYVREVLRIQAEIISNRFSPETLQKMTHLDYPTGQEKTAAQQRLQQLQQQQQQMQAQQAQQPPPQPGQPAPPDPTQNPAVQQAMEEAKQLSAVVAKPSWDEIKQLLSDALLYKYRLDIETDSTIDAESSMDKEAINDLLMAIAQIFQNTGPLVQEGVMPMGAVKGLLLTVVRRFRLGSELEEYLEMIPDQMPPKPPDPKIQAAQMEAQQSQEEHQMNMQAKQADMAMKDKENTNKMALMDKELQIQQAELDLKARELQMKEVELQQKQELNQITHSGKVQLANAKSEQAMQQLAISAQTFEQQQAQKLQAAQQPKVQ
jgi:hypothetical protein